MKIIDKINQSIVENKPFFSLEFFPPKTKAGIQNLYDRLERMARLEPAFVDFTWGAGGSTSQLTLELCQSAQKYFALEVMMHLTCTNISEAEIRSALNSARDAGIKNILALRGDPPVGSERWVKRDDGFAFGADLTGFIRTEFDDWFGVGVAGYPGGHPESASLESDIAHQKSKVDAGADFIITQLFYDVEEYIQYVRLCRKAGIECPVIPGLLPITNYQRFKKFTDFCQTKIPREISDQLELVKNDDAAVRAFGIDLCVKMCRELRDAGAPGFHFYTLNLEDSVKAIVGELGLIDNASSRRALPWRQPTVPERNNETVRPIFWSNRPQSYLARTEAWDSYPNGRWGDSSSPAFGNLNDYHLIRSGLGQQKDKRLAEWGEPQTFEDICNVFVDFCYGKITHLPWCEGSIRPESKRIETTLVELNRHGVLTINSQPQLNGVDSADPVYGWGGTGGLVYQKAYVEFFVSPADWGMIESALKLCPTVSWHAVNNAGDSSSNIQEGVNAVTWGVFPGKEVIQPTVVDSVSFEIWKAEAFSLWKAEWAQLYPEDSKSPVILNTIADEWYLVNLVENNYINGDIFKVFEAAGLLIKSRVRDSAQSVNEDMLNI